MITLKTVEELAIMRKASTIVAEILEELAGAVRPGITTFELDKMAEELTYKKGAKPAFKGYMPAMCRIPRRYASP
jgi:methionyl aminopeptidase